MCQSPRTWPWMLALQCIANIATSGQKGPLVNLLQTLLPGMTKGRLHVKRTGEQLHLGSSGI